MRVLGELAHPASLGFLKVFLVGGGALTGLHVLLLGKPCLSFGIEGQMY